MFEVNDLFTTTGFKWIKPRVGVGVV